MKRVSMHLGHVLSAVTQPSFMAGSLCYLALLLAPSPGLGVEVAPSPPKDSDFMALDIQELGEIKITSVSKKEQNLADAAAAIFVITQDDIRRSGVTNIPDALRMVPGVQVARIDTNRWAISARGFNSPWGDKLLVLIDGRTVYSPLFSGVFWDVQDTLIEDINRIEVIRGPGATLWGANAVNGVINIITKHSEDTQGGLVATGGGTEERFFGGVRYGGTLGDATTYRVYAKYFNRDPSVDAAGNRTADSWWAQRAGFRADHAVTSQETLTLQGDIYKSNAGQTLNMYLPTAPFLTVVDDRVRSNGGNVLGRWSREGTDRGMSLQLYYDRAVRNEAELSERIDTFDLDFQHRFTLGSRNEVIWGVGYRFTSDSFVNSNTVMVLPDKKKDHLFSGFLQDQITVVPEHLKFIFGTKLEHNDYSGFEVQPNARLIWTPDHRNSIWASVSRAVKTPYRFSHDARFAIFSAPPPDNAPPNIQSTFGLGEGNTSYKSEELLAYELGYRSKVHERLSLDIATFYNVYHNLTTYEPGPPEFTQTQLVLPFTWGNKMHGYVYGAEVAADWDVLTWWRLRAAYSYLRMQLQHSSDSGDTLTLNQAGENPQHQLSVRSSFDLRKDLELDLWLRYVDDLPKLSVPSYTTLDVRLGWKPVRNLEISVTGQNLLQSHHSEFTQFNFNQHPTEVQRGVYGKIAWQF